MQSVLPKNLCEKHRNTLVSECSLIQKEKLERTGQIVIED